MRCGQQPLRNQTIGIPNLRLAGAGGNYWRSRISRRIPAARNPMLTVTSITSMNKADRPGTTRCSPRIQWNTILSTMPRAPIAIKAPLIAALFRSFMSGAHCFSRSGSSPVFLSMNLLWCSASVMPPSVPREPTRIRWRIDRRPTYSDCPRSSDRAVVTILQRRAAKS
jgi:hypothetical protein